MAMSHQQHPIQEDPFLHDYKPSELRIASEFLTTWLPFLSRDLCPGCTQSLSNRIRALDPGNFRSDENSMDVSDMNSLGSWKDGVDEGIEAEGVHGSSFMNVGRRKDFVFFERFKGRMVNILQGLELHTGVFSVAEQKRIVDHVYELQEMGKNGGLRDRTFSAPRKWMKGKGRVTMQFGCCYNYAPDRNGNPPGVLQTEIVDPIPSLFKVMIRKMVRWHVLPPTCVPDSCIVNIYEEDDCIPPHIDNHDFVRPFCTVSFLSECNILFGTNLSSVGPGEFAGPVAIPLPVGSVLVLKGNGADVAKHCVPAVPTKRISITFRRMDDSKRPTGYAPEPDLLGIQPLPYEASETDVPTSPVSSERDIRRPPFKRGSSHLRNRESGHRSSDARFEPRNTGRGAQYRSVDRRGRVNFDN